MKLALVKPPIIGSSTRGVGYYLSHLIDSLAKNPEIDLSVVDFSQNPKTYSDFDLVHFPYFDPFFLTLPIIKPPRMILTIHDLTPIVFPEGFPPGIKGELKWQIQKNLVASSNWIITDSDNSKRDILKNISIAESKISVVPLAADIKFKPLENRNQPEKFFLYVGDVNFNKNIPGLIRAFNEFNKKDNSYKLILVGESFKNEELPEVKEIIALINKYNLKNEVIFRGYMPINDLVLAYNHAMAYIQPSIYEGFGLTILEAMQSGCPVICGNNSSLPEIGGRSVIYSQVTDAVLLSDSMQVVSKLTKNERKEIIKKGLEQAKNFSWEKCAKETFEVYEKILTK